MWPYNNFKTRRLTEYSILHRYDTYARWKQIHSVQDTEFFSYIFRKRMSILLLFYQIQNIVVLTWNIADKTNLHRIHAVDILWYTVHSCSVYRLLHVKPVWQWIIKYFPLLCHSNTWVMSITCLLVWQLYNSVSP
jgi:hypothetical protein